MLQALEEMGFIDQFTRSVDYQFALINANRFSVHQDTNDYNPVVVVTVELNFHFSPSGFLSQYDRITAVQIKPFHFIFGTTEGSDDDAIMIQLVVYIVPIWMIIQEIKEMNEVGFKRWISSGWNVFELVYIGAVILFFMSVKSYMAAETLFLNHYREMNDDTEYPEYSRFNDVMPLRARYKEMNKFIGIVVAISVFKLFKYIKIFRSTTVLWDTIDKAKHQLVAYMGVMMVLIMGFTWMTVYLWGYESKSFHKSSWRL
jgi:hypothetical protein